MPYSESILLSFWAAGLHGRGSEHAFCRFILIYSCESQLQHCTQCRALPNVDNCTPCSEGKNMMIDAARHRANTSAPPNRGCLDSPSRSNNPSSFLGLPPPYGGFMLPNSMHPSTKGFLTCFFWCGHTEEADSEMEEEEDLSVGMPDYLFGRRLGQGRQGEVRHAIQRSDGQSVAVKCVRRHRHADDQTEIEGVLEEAAVLKRLSHSSIVSLMKFESLPSCNYLVLELLDGGELLDAVAGLATYTEHDARQIAIALLKGLAHAHDSARCVHRDLRPEKLLLQRDPVGTKSRSLGRRVKITGWGRAKLLPDNGLVPGEPCFSAKAFSAPEMLLGESHGASADMFAVGAILYTLLSGSPPRAAGLVAAINPAPPDVSGPAWGGVSSEAKGLVGALMTPRGPAARLTARQALGHSWIRAGERALRARSLEAVLKGARVLSWRGAMDLQKAGNGVQGAAIPRVRSMF